MMQHLADGFTGAAVLAGLWAASLWWRSATVLPFNVQWRSGKEIDGPDAAWKAETALFMQSVMRARDLTGRAAVGAIAAIVFQAVATVLSRLAVP